MNIAHHQSDSSFHSYSRWGYVVVAGGWVFDHTLEAEDTKLSPAGRKVGVGYFGHTCERHRLIIRFLLHDH